MSQTTNPSKKRGRPPKNDSTSKDLPSQNDINNQPKPIYNFGQIFKKIDGVNTVIQQKIKNYTLADLEMYVSDPVRYVAQLIDINNFMYNYSMYYQRLIDYYVKSIYYRWTVDTEIKNINFYNAKDDTKLKKSYITFVNRINQLNLGAELHRILTKMLIEDCVYGYWLEDGDSSAIYYLPSGWCAIKSTMNGMYSCSINTNRVSQQDILKLPKELQSLINKYKGKSGDAAYAPIPYEKSICFKWNNHFDYIFPPMTSVITTIVELLKAKQINMTRYELDAMTLIEMLIPIADDNDDHLRLTEDVVKQFVLGASELVPDNVGIIPTPMKLTALPLNKSQTIDKNIVRESIDTYNEETGLPSFGSANNASEMKKAIENSSASMFTILEQISNGINLKMQLEGFTYPAFAFKFKLLNITVFNETDVQESMFKAANAGAVNKFEWMASYGKNPAVTLGQAHLENVAFRDIFDNLTVLPRSFTQSSNATNGGGRPTNESVGKELSPQGQQTQDGDLNDENRNI